MPTTYAIPNGATQFAATLWTGNSGTQSINNAASTSGITFQPDFAWVKKTNGTDNHELTDSVRGNNLRLASNTTDPQTAGGIAFASNGLTLTGGFGTDNQTGFTYVGWQWKAGGAAVTNTNGFITSQVSVNSSAKFSIVSYTGVAGNVGRTIGHGLGVAPKMIILKGMVAGSTGTDNWVFYTQTTGAGNFLTLNSTAAATPSTTYWNNTAPDLNVFSVGGNSANVSNESGKTYIAYCWADVDGYSKFGSYVGTGNTNGAFVYLGFKPRFIMIKQSSGSTAYTSWFMIDTTRMPSNINSGTVPSLWSNLAVQQGLRGNGVAADTINYIDILSNGFKIRANATDEINNNASTYIYAAFAENPFKYANAE
jgi:hypothetical protein